MFKIFITYNWFITFLFFYNLYSPVKIESQESSVLINYTVAEEEIVNNNILYFENDFNGFKEFMAFKESSGSFKSINKFGFMGKYQFNLNTLKIYKLKNASNFLKNPELQERIFLINCQRNKWILRKDINWFVGTVINGTEITESGILAAAHLSGPGNVKKYLRSDGKNNLKDAFGTSISKYMNTFKNYNVSSVSAIQKPSI